MKIYLYSAVLYSALLAANENLPQNQDFLHIAINNGKFVIYVWDTREVIYAGTVPADVNIEAIADRVVAIDNHKALKFSEELKKAGANPKDFMFRDHKYIVDGVRYKTFKNQATGETAFFRRGSAIIIDGTGAAKIVSPVEAQPEGFEPAKSEPETTIALIKATEAMAIAGVDLTPWIEGAPKPEKPAKEEAPAKS